MTPRKKRSYRLPPREERPSEAPQDENPLGESRQGDQSSPEPTQADSAAPVVSAQPSGEPEIYFPPLKSDGMGGFTPLPARSGAARNAESPPSSGVRRRRRSTPLLTRPDVSELGGRLESMAGRALPTFDFFLFSLLAGLILGIGYLLDAPAILLFGILVAPVLTPWAGAALAAAMGEIRFLGQTLGGFATALLTIFVTGLVAGWIARIFMPIATTQALTHAQLGLFDLLLLAAGTVALAVRFVQSDEKPLLTSLMVAYEIYLPVSAAGFGLGSGAANLWPQALMVLLVHLAVSALLALIVFYYMGFRPLEASGYALLALIAVASLAAIFAGFASGNNFHAIPLPATPTRLTSTPTAAVVPATFTVEPRPSPTHPLATPTITVTPGPTLIPTPVYGHVRNNGAYIRDEPGGSTLIILEEGYLVEFLPDTPLVLEGTTWVRVRAKIPSRDADVVGWVLLSRIATATPPAPQPSDTPTAGPTSTITATPTEGPSLTPTETLQATGSYSVVNISQYEGSLNVRSRAGVNNSLAGSLAYTATDIGRIGSPVIVGSAEWWQVQKKGGVTGWVNAFYLTEYIPPVTFCADARVTTLLTNLGAAIKNSDGAALAALVSPRHGLDIRLVSNNSPVNYTKATAASIFTDTTTQNWGPAEATDSNINGTFMDIIQPKLLEVYNSSYQLSCNDTSKVGPVNQPWPSEYTTVNFYSIYKPSTGDTPSWRNFLVGIEYIDGEPTLFALIHFEPVP